MGLILDANRAAMAYWAATGYTDAAINQLGREHEGTFYFVKLIVHRGRSVNVIASRKVGEDGGGHIPACLKFFRLVVDQMPDSAHGTCMLWAEDAFYEWISEMGLRVPILAFGRHVTAKHCFLVPDPAYMDSGGYLQELQEIDQLEATLPWRLKAPNAFWRGAASGLGMELDNDAWLDSPRVRLGLKSKELDDPSTLNAYISKVDIFSNERFSERVRALGIVKEYVPLGQMLNYKYQIDVDGISCAWISCFLKMASQCAVLKVHSDYAQWYYHALKPWQHFLPVARNLSDLVEVIEWAKAHDFACHQIAEQGRDFMRAIRVDDTILETAALLTQLFSYQRA